MFKLIVCFVVVASVVSGVPIDRKDVTTEKREIIPLLSFESDRNPDGSFSFAYEGGDQSYRQESGVVENAGTDDEALEISGSYRYIDADGQLVEVHYTAGKNGFVPTGTIIPGEITQLAKNAASLPNFTEEQERESRLSQRRARSQSEPEVVTILETKTEEKKELAPSTVAEPKPAESRSEIKTETETVTITETKAEEKKTEEKKPEVKKVEEKKAEEKEEQTLSTAVEPKAAVSEVVPVQVVLEQKPVAEKLEKSELKIESKTA